MAFPLPRDLELAAVGLYFHGGAEQTARDPHRDCGAGAGAAGERFPASPLENPQLDALPVVDLHVASVHPLRKTWMLLDQRPLGQYRRRLDVSRHLHRMWIAHGY